MRVGRAEDHVVDTPFGFGLRDHLRGRKDDEIHRDNRQRNLFVLEHEHAGIQRIAHASALVPRISTATSSAGVMSTLAVPAQSRGAWGLPVNAPSRAEQRQRDAQAGDQAVEVQAAFSLVVTREVSIPEAARPPSLAPCSLPRFQVPTLRGTWRATLSPCLERHEHGRRLAAS